MSRNSKQFLELESKMLSDEIKDRCSIQKIEIQSTEQFEKEKARS